MYNSNDAHYKEGESMRVIFESWFVKYKVDVIFAGHVHAYERSYRFSNIDYNITSGTQYPVADKSAPVYITVGDGGNQEGLASRPLKMSSSTSFGSSFLYKFLSLDNADIYDLLGKTMEEVEQPNNNIQTEVLFSETNITQTNADVDEVDQVMRGTVNETINKVKKEHEVGEYSQANNNT